MPVRKVLVLAALSLCLSAVVYAQSTEVRRIAVLPLTLDKGFPLKVVLTEKVRSRLNEPVHGKILDPVYALDREVIPAGTEVLGKVTGLKPVGTWKRLSSMLGGDFTPLHDAEVTFDTLVFANGKHIPIQTAVSTEGNVLVRFKNGRVRSYTTGSQQSGTDMLHSMLWGLSPYHPQFVASGTTYKATLEEPIEFGNVFYGTGVLSNIGSDPMPGSIIYARLTTALDSKKTKVETPVEAILTYPLYGGDHRLIFPAGSRLEGEVTEVHKAGFMSHGGELAVQFTRIAPPITLMSSASQAREIHGRMMGVEVSPDLNQLRINSDGIAEVPRTKQRFVAPVFALAGAAPMISAGASSFAPALGEAYGTNAFSRMFGGGTGFGLPAGVAGLMVPPVGIGLGAYSVGYAVYFNILGHGKNISLPADTNIEIRVDRPTE